MPGSRAFYLSVVVLLASGVVRHGAAAQAPAGDRDASAAATAVVPPEPQAIEVVVTGARTEERLDRAVSTTEVIKRREIEQSGARDAAELLEERPGLQVMRSFRGSGIQLRGLDPEYTLILVDSERIPGQVDGAIDLSRYGSENIERIEIVRGPGSALYGADAIAGVINILTRESKRDFEADLLGSYGQRNVFDLSGSVAGRPTERLGLRVTADLHRADSYSEPGETETTISGRNQWSTGLRVGFEPDSRNRLVLRAAYLRAEWTGIDVDAAKAVFDRSQLQEQPHVSVEHRLRPSDRVQLVSRVSYSQFRDQYLHDQRGATALDEYQDNREYLGQLSSIASFELADRHRTTAGVEELVQHLDSERLTRSGQRARYAAFIQHAWLLFERDDSELEIVPGFRVDSDTQFGTQPSPKIALRYKLLGHLELRASYGHGFRAPSFQEQLLRFENPSVGYIVNGNPNLKAETSRGLDASVRWWNELLDLNVTFFRNDLHNMIAYQLIVPDDPRATGSRYMEYLYENVETAWTMGVESAAALKLRDELNCTVSYTYADTWDAETQRRIGSRARHRLTANFRAMHPTSELEFVARAAVSWGRLYYVPDMNAPDGERAAHPAALAQLDLRAAKHFGRLLELFVGIDNLLNAGDDYAVLRPRTVYGGLRGRY